MVVRINGKAYEIVSKAEAKTLLKQQIQSVADDITNELRNSLVNEISKEVMEDVKNNITCNTSWTNYQAQSQDQIWKYWNQINSYYRASGEHQPYKNGEYSCPTSLNIFYKGQLKRVVS